MQYVESLCCSRWWFVFVVEAVLVESHGYWSNTLKETKVYHITITTSINFSPKGLPFRLAQESCEGSFCTHHRSSDGWIARFVWTGFLERKRFCKYGFSHMSFLKESPKHLQFDRAQIKTTTYYNDCFEGIWAWQTRLKIMINPNQHQDIKNPGLIPPLQKKFQKIFTRFEVANPPK